MFPRTIHQHIHTNPHPTTTPHTHPQLEIDSGTELSAAILMEELHPQQTAYRPKFNKPAPPANRRKAGRQNNRNGDQN